MEFLHGIHLPNRDIVSIGDPEIALVRRAKFNAAKAFDYTSNADIVRLRDECGIRDWVIRLWWSGQPSSPSNGVDVKIRRLVEMLGGPLRDCNVIFEPGNEPNHCGSVDGWGPGPGKVGEFCSWYLATAWLLRYEFQWRMGWVPPICFPGLANGDVHNDSQWYEDSKDALSPEHSQFVGVHAYWQGENHLDPTWGLRYLRYPFQKRVIITEYGDSSFQNLAFDASPETRARRIYEWLEEAQKSVIVGAFYFLLGGTPDWTGFRLDEATADAMASAIT